MKELRNEKKDLLDVSEDEMVETSVTDDSVLETSMDDISEEAVKEISKKLSVQASAYDEEEKKESIHRASAQEKRELYKSDYIVAIDEKLRSVKETDQRRRDYLELVHAQKSKGILRGTIVGRDDEYGTSGNLRQFAVVVHGQFIVRIPFYELVPHYKPNPSRTEKENNKIIRDMINARIGSEIEYCVLDVTEASGSALGSRVMAMRSIMYAHYFLPAGKKLIDKGNKVEARVCYSTKHIVCVEVFGVECILREGDISHRRLIDARKLYKPGDIVQVKITDIERNKTVVNGKNAVSVKLKCSIREATENPAKTYWNVFKEGNTFQGRVVQITEDGIFVKINGFEVTVLCMPPKEFKLPELDSTVKIAIFKKNLEQYRISGYILHEVI